MPRTIPMLPSADGLVVGPIKHPLRWLNGKFYYPGNLPTTGMIQELAASLGRVCLESQVTQSPIQFSERPTIENRG